MPPRERFHDPSFQRYAQSFRRRESLRAAGKEGYSVTIGRYGKEYLHDRMADKRRESELPRSVSERQLMRMLEELGQRQDRARSTAARAGTTIGSTSSRHPGTPTSSGRSSTRRSRCGAASTQRQFFVRQERVQEANLRQIDGPKRRAGTL